MKKQSFKLEQMLIKKALGYRVKETSEEYILDNSTEQFKLVKRKVNTKYIAPDISAAKLYAENFLTERDVSNLTDEELISEKARLLIVLNQLNNMEENNVKTDNGDDEL